MQRENACNVLESKIRRALDELRRCRDGAAPPGGTDAFVPLRAAADAVPAQQRAFPPGVLEELAKIVACPDPSSAAAGACASVLYAVGCQLGAHKARQQVLRSKQALRCARTL